MTTEEWWQNCISPETKADIFFYYHLTYEVFEAIIKANNITPNEKLDFKISSTPLWCSVLDFKLELIDDNKVVHSRQLNPVNVTFKESNK